MRTLLDEVDPREPIDETGTQDDTRAVFGHYGFLPWELIHLNLPYRSIEGTSWTRHNGRYTVTVTAGPVSYPDGTTDTVVPFGKYARAALLWMCTQAKLTGRPRIETGGSYREFMENLGIQYGARAGALALAQMRALMAATFHITEHSEDGRTIQDLRFLITKESVLRFADDRGEELSEDGPSALTLSSDFFGSIQERGVPLDMASWRHIQDTSKSPMALDIYAWLSSRLPNVQRPTRISWAQLQDQFGSTSDTKEFKRLFRVALVKALEVYPGANIQEIGAGERKAGFKGFLLNKSMAAVPPRELSKS